jgi:hypothetical protein
MNISILNVCNAMLDVTSHVFIVSGRGRETSISPRRLEHSSSRSHLHAPRHQEPRTSITQSPPFRFPPPSPTLIHRIPPINNPNPQYSHTQKPFLTIHFPSQSPSRQHFLKSATTWLYRLARQPTHRLRKISHFVPISRFVCCTCAPRPLLNVAVIALYMRC